MLVLAHRVPRDAVGCAALVEAGAGAFEADLQLRRGEVVVSHHLPFLRIPGWLEHDGRRFRWGGGRVLDPTLSEVMAYVPTPCAVLLDPKETSSRARRALVEAVGDSVPVADRGRLRVSTSDAGDLAAYRALGITTWRTIGDRRALDAFLAAGPFVDDGVSIRHTLLSSARVVERLHNVVGTVVAWTVDDVASARRLVSFGVDGVTTDRVEVMRALR